MLSRDLLEMCRAYDEDMLKLKEHRALLSDMAGSLSVSTDGNGGSRSGVSDRTGRYAMKLAAADEMIAIREQMHDAEETAACHLIECIAGIDARILHRYYVRRDTLRGVAAKFNYSIEYIRRRRRTGLNLLPENVPD